ncbi:glycosyltransferase [Haliangium sp.]|uniref:glycosyltransferase n=1 Tax=Haliangium sp. TaxID=2663208 RepID=UPI003D1366C7
MQPLRVLDFNSMFSFSGGGIRTYHLRKLAYFGDRADVAYHLAVPSDRDAVEVHGNARLHHLRTPALLEVRNYALTIAPRRLLALIDELSPDLIEAGGPYTDPLLARLIRRRYGGVLVGFWHTHYPDAYLGFYGQRLGAAVSRTLEAVGWRLARASYEVYDATIAAADCIIADLARAGIRRVIQCPLGIDSDRFCPDRADPALRRSVGADERPLVLFAHRFLPEKGIRELVAAVPRIAETTGAVFAFAGLGPELALVEALCRERADCHLLGFIDDVDELARWMASSDLAYGMSAWETFGFSVIEAMASGAPLVGADRGAARDWITRADCGLVVPHGDAEALARASVELLTRPDRDEVGQRGRDYVLAHFSWERALDRMLGFYRVLVDAHRTGVRVDEFPYLLDVTPAAAWARARASR